MARHFPKGLDGRMRDRDGEIRKKRSDTHVGTLRKEYGDGFARGYRANTKLGTVLKREGAETSGSAAQEALIGIAPYVAALSVAEVDGDCMSDSFSSSESGWLDQEWSQQLSSILARGECQEVEFKVDFPKNARDLAKEIAGFATSNAGIVVMGITDQGQVGGLAAAQTPDGRRAIVSRLEGISRMISPPITPQFAFASLESAVLLVIDVPKGSAPVYYVENIPYLRHITISRPATPQEASDLHYALHQRSDLDEANDVLMASLANATPHDLAPGFQLITFDERQGVERSVVVAQGAWIEIRLQPDPRGTHWSQTKLWELAGASLQLVAPPNCDGQSLECHRNRQGAGVWPADRENPDVAAAATQLYMHGDIKSIDTTLLGAPTPGRPSIPFERLASELTKTIQRLAEFAFKRIQVAPTIDVVVGVNGVEKYRISHGGKLEGWVDRPGIWSQIKLTQDASITADAVVPFMREIWDAAGLPSERFPG